MRGWFQIVGNLLIRSNQFAVLTLNATLPLLLFSFLLFIVLLDWLILQPLSRVREQRQTSLDQLTTASERLAADQVRVSDELQTQKETAQSELASELAALNTEYNQQCGEAATALTDEFRLARQQHRDQLQAEYEQALEQLSQQKTELAALIKVRLGDTTETVDPKTEEVVTG